MKIRHRLTAGLLILALLASTALGSVSFATENVPTENTGEASESETENGTGSSDETGSGKTEPVVESEDQKEQEETLQEQRLKQESSNNAGTNTGKSKGDYEEEGVVPTVVPSVAKKEKLGAPTGRSDAVGMNKGLNVSGTNQYILSVASGSIGATDKLLYIAVCYTDVDGKRAKAFVLPDEKTCQDTFDLGMSVQGVANAEKQNTEMRNSMGVSATHMKRGDVGKPLAPYKCSQFLFQTMTGIKTVDDIEILTNGGSQEWTLSGIQVYQLDTVYGVSMVGGCSDTWELAFKGKLLGSSNLGVGESGSESSNAIAGKDLSWTNEKIISLKGERAFTSKNADYDQAAVEKGNQYFFRFDIRNAADSGMNANANTTGASLRHMALSEAMVIKLRYRDTYNCLREVDIPAVTATRQFLVNDCPDAVNDSVVDGVGQQGGTLGFPVWLPAFKDISSIYCYTGSSMSGKDIDGLKISNVDKDEDGFVFSGAALYDITGKSVGSEVAISRTGVALSYEFTQNTPAFIRKASGETGIPMGANERTKLMLLKSENGDTMESRSKDNAKDKYLVALITDTPEAAGTESDVEIQIGYTKKDGKTTYSRAVSNTAAAKEYYGDWPGTPQKDFCYRHGTFPGNTLLFTVSASNVKQFDMADMELKGKDDYQISGIEIFELDTLGDREGILEPVEDKNGKTLVNSSPFTYFRPYSGKRKASIHQPILLTGGNPTATVDLLAQTVSDDEIVDAGLTGGYQFSMTYEDTQRNWGFAKPRKTYRVAVRVETGILDSESNDDAGSKNRFYFQLLFDSGRSGLVCANDQLVGDGFRSGAEENFTIYTNQDYGDVVGLNIIPDTVSDDVDRNDKLMIRMITITEQSFGGKSRRWTINNVGEIDIDYFEKGDENTIIGRKGMTLAEASRTFNVDATGEAVNLLFCISNGGLGDSGIQFQGTVEAKISYKNKKSEPETKSFDVVQAMSDYNSNLSDNVTESTETKQGTDSGTGRTISKEIRTSENQNLALSDKKWMFRPNSTDRFVISMENVSSIDSIEFTFGSRTNAVWTVNNISVDVVLSNSRPVLNAANEFTRSEKVGDKPLCSTEASSKVAVNWDAQQTIYFPFSLNKIELDATDTYVSTLSRTPVSQNDEFNVYIFPYTGKGSGDPSSYQLSAALRYTNIDGYARQVKADQNTLRRGTVDLGDGEGQRSLFYIRGLAAPRFSSMIDMTVAAPIHGRGSADVSMAIVQRIRSNVVLDSYIFDYENMDVSSLSFTQRPNPQRERPTNEKQLVAIQFGSDTDDVTLQAADPETKKEEKDLVVRFKYTSRLDPLERTQYSPNIFLTDQDIKRIGPGKVILVEVPCSYVRNVGDLSMATMGGVKAEVDCAYVQTMTVDDENVDYSFAGANESSKKKSDDGEDEEKASEETPETTLIGHYSYNAGAKLSGNLQAIKCSSDDPTQTGTVLPLEISIKTKETSSLATESGINDAVRMNIGYRNSNDQNRVREIKDAREYVVEERTFWGDVVNGGKNFTTGSERIIQMLMKDTQEIQYIDLEPYDKDTKTTVAWTPEKLAMRFGIGSGTVDTQRSIDETIHEGSPKRVYFIDLSLSAVASRLDGSSVKESRTVQSGGEEGFLIENGEYLQITTKYLGVDPCKYMAYRVSGNTKAQDNSLVSKVSSNVLRFNPPKNEGLVNEDYSVVLESPDDPTLTLTINISVKPEVKENTDESEESGDDEEQEEQENGDEEGGVEDEE